jgi:hypothetical protein
MTDATIWERLAAPFPDALVEHLPEAAGAGSAAYVTIATVEDRLDEVLGPQGWSCEFRVIASEGTQAAVECTLTIGNVSKADAGEADFAEPFKAAYSDALKRAARRFGVARYLAQSPDQPRVKFAGPPSSNVQPPEPDVVNVPQPEPGEEVEPPRPTDKFLADIKESWSYDPDQVLDILGITMDRVKALTHDQQNRAWAKIRETAETVDAAMPF